MKIEHKQYDEDSDDPLHVSTMSRSIQQQIYMLLHGTDPAENEVLYWLWKRLKEDLLECKDEKMFTGDPSAKSAYNMTSILVNDIFNVIEYGKRIDEGYMDKTPGKKKITTVPTDLGYTKVYADHEYIGFIEQAGNYHCFKPQAKGYVECVMYNLPMLIQYLENFDPTKPVMTDE